MKRILFYVGYQSSPLHPSNLHQTGLGGSETALCEIAQYLANHADEFDVTVTGSTETDRYRDIDYINTEVLRENVERGYIDPNYDLVIAINYIHYLHELDFLSFNDSIFWIHNTEHFPWWKGDELDNNGDYTYEDERMSLVVCVSEWQRDVIVEKYPACAHKVRVMENGFDRSLFSESMPLIPEHRVFVYSSAPDRGLNRVIHAWPTIKHEYPDAILKIFCPEYSLDHLQTLADEWDLYNMDGVEVVGSVAKGRLYQEIENARYWLYPSSYEETFCITALEMMFGKTICITTDSANLKHIMSPYQRELLDSSSHEADIEMGLINQVNKYEQLIDGDDSSRQVVVDLLCDAQLHASLYQWKNVGIKWKALVQPLTPQRLMQHIFIISLKPDNQSNREKWCEQVEASGLKEGEYKIHVFPAVNGNDVDNAYLEQHNMKVYPYWKLHEATNDWWTRDVRPGELGCAISHYQVWNRIAEHKLERAVIFEDDFNFTGTPLTEQTLSHVPCNWDMLYLGRIPLTSEGHDNDDVVVKPGPSYNMHAYALTCTGAEKLMQQNFQNRLMPVDEFIQATYTEHQRSDLNEHVWRDNICYALHHDVFSQSRSFEESQTENVHKQGRLHPELYTFHEDRESWFKRFLVPGVMDMEIQLMVDEPVNNVFSFPLFTKEFCEMIREEAEHSQSWTTDRHEFYPTTDMVLDVIGFNDIYDTILREFVEPMIRECYGLEGNDWNNMDNENFLARYTPDTQPLLKVHHDFSDISSLVNLSCGEEEYTGGGTYFPKYKQLHRPPQGTMSVHPGCITHKHGARPVLSGQRYIIVSFMKRRR